MPLPAGKVRVAAFAALAALLAAAAGAWTVLDGKRERSQLGLLTSLPIYWAESFELGETLDDQAAPHWARSALEEGYRLVPLDTLDSASPPLGELDYLLLAQPRALSPAENVALDDWVRAGGRVLIFADPLLTGPSRFHIGDRRRPQDVILLSPILRRWGLELRFDPDQQEGERQVAVWGAAVPVSQAGSFVPVPTSAPSDCTIEAGGLAADCRIGQGRAVVVADAAMLEQEREPVASREALEILAGRAYRP